VILLVEEDIEAFMKHMKPGERMNERTRTLKDETRTRLKDLLQKPFL